MRVRKFGLLLRIALSSVMILVTPAIAHATCPEDFARFGRISDPNDVSSVLTSAARDRLMSVHDTLVEKVLADVRRTGAATAGISNATLRIADDLTRRMAEDLAQQGYHVEIVKRPLVPITVEGVAVNIGSRDVLKVSAGTAKSDFARELTRYSKDIAARLKDPKAAALFKEGTNAPFEVSVDPLLTLLGRSNAYFSPHEQWGLGITLSHSILASRSDKAVEVIRHEIRHSKSFFDIMSGKETVSRAWLNAATPEELKKLATYRSSFAIDEIFAFESQVRSAQQQLGKLTEQMRKAMASKNPPTPQEIEGYKRDVKWLRERGTYYAETVTQMSTSTKTYAAQLRARLADPFLSDTKFAARIREITELNKPGVRQMNVTINDDPSIDAASLRIAIPESVYSKGTRAIREYIVKYCSDLEKSVTKAEERNANRIADLNRDPMSRLKQAPAKLSEPTVIDLNSEHFP